MGRHLTPVGCFRFVVLLLISSTMAAAAPVKQFTRQTDGLLLSLQPGTLRLQVFSESIIRVTYSAGETLPELKSFSVVATPSTTAKWDVQDTADAVILKTPAITAEVNRKSGEVAFYDASHHLVLQETADGREISAATEPGVAGTLVRQSFNLPADEGIYGLGQHQQNIWNYHGHTVRLLQQNMEVGIPVMLSSKGYVLLWDNPAVTDISAGAPSGPATAPAHGVVTPDGAGEHVLRWSSETGKAIDYYFILGSSPADSLRSYRQLTGPAPLMPKWLLGYWQCKERYRTQAEVLGVAKQYRDLGVPIDGIIQDWRYWPDNTWGSHNFDPARYPDPAAMMKQLHEMHYHTLISVWPKFDLGTANITELENAGAMLDPVIQYVYPPGKGKWYDPFSADGLRIYWKQVSTELFSKGFDGWWLDAPEPELGGKWGEFRSLRTSAGPGAVVFNAYPLMHSTGIYQGQRAQTDDHRVVILTRSAYAGQQRNSAITWSGDIGSTWQTLRAQVPAGLNFSVSGIPYWNTDIGGFYGKMDPSDPRYRELFSRWFEFGSFCPMFRVHGGAPNGGTGPGKEFWRWDAPTQQIWRTYVDLRYRLMPYTYSVAWQVTSAGGSIMRPLVMDFSDDGKTLNIGDQYLFGPAIMVNPVTTQGATSRSVYLPGKDNWFDFWTGQTESGGQRIDTPAPVQTMPIFVRAGSIIPMGPLIQYTSEKPADPIELRIYRGADGQFTLYEDEEDTYHYEKGIYATIPISWNQAGKTLTIGQRKGAFPGMLEKRTLNIVFVGDHHGAGVGVTDMPDKTVVYDGKPVSVAAE